MHFFSPANVMRLLEIVRGKATAFDVLATALAVGRRIGKVPAVVGVCDGFVGNRMLHRRSAQAEKLLLEGALAAGGGCGGHGVRLPHGAVRDERPRRARCRLAHPQGARRARGGLGRAVRGGAVRAEDECRAISATSRARARRCPIPRWSASSSRRRRRKASRGGQIAPEEILDRMLLPMINEARAHPGGGDRVAAGRCRCDLDATAMAGPRIAAARCSTPTSSGSPHVRDRLNALAAQTGDDSLRPAALLDRLADEGKGFASLKA